MFAFIFELGSLICAVSQSSGMLIGGRTIAGLGASGLVNGGMTVISGSAPLQKRPRKSIHTLPYTFMLFLTNMALSQSTPASCWEVRHQWHFEGHVRVIFF